MKKRTLSKYIALGFWIVGGIFSASGQSYSMDWFKIAGGGGTSAGGTYSVSGTIGQADAGAQPMTGGSYSLTGGFWALYAVQTPGAPKLTVSATSTNTVVVSWPRSSVGWAVQQNTNLGTVNWVAPSETVQQNATSNFIIVTPPTGNRFYRLSPS
jgi:hypothetical protein